MVENPLSHSAVHGLMTHVISISFRMFKNLSGFSASKPSYICKKINQNKKQNKNKTNIIWLSASTLKLY